MEDPLITYTRKKFANVHYANPCEREDCRAAREELDELCAKRLSDVERSSAQFSDEPAAFAIETPGGDWFDGEYSVFSDRRSAEVEVENLNDDIPESREQYKVVPLYRAARPRS